MGDEYPVSVPIDSAIIDRTFELRATEHDDLESFFNDIATIMLHVKKVGEIDDPDLVDLDLETEAISHFDWADTAVLDDLCTLGFLRQTNSGYSVRG